MRRFISLVIVALVLTLAGGGTALAQFRSMSDTSSTLNFHVDGSAEGLPDAAIIHYTVIGDGETIAKASQQLQQAQDTIVKAVAKYDVKPAQIEAERFSINPVQPNPNGGGMRSPSDSSLPLGFRASKDFKIQIPMTSTNLDKLFQIADAAFQQGARIASSSGGYSGDYGSGGPGFMEFILTDSDKLSKSAMDDGMARARKLADYAIQDMGKKKVTVSRLQVTQSQMGTSRGGGRGGMSPNQPFSSTIWQPIRVVVSLDVSFTYE